MRDVTSLRFDDDGQDSFDDVDALFNQLERFEPPTDMVERIMDAVAKLPLPQHLPQNVFDKDDLVVQYDDKQPS